MEKRTGGKIVGYFCTYCPEAIYYAIGVLPVRILGAHKIQDVTEPHIFTMSCPFCQDVQAQGLQGKYDYLDGITIGQSCIHLRRVFTSRESHKNPGWSRFPPMTSHFQSPWAAPSGLERDVYSITGEPYGASCAFDKPLSAEFLQASVNFGLARDRYVFGTLQKSNPKLADF